MYSTGLGRPQDDAEAVRWLRLAADQGHAQAQADLALFYSNGLGVAQDYAEAVRWLRLAADQGQINALHNLGGMYRNGLGVPQDYVEAHKWRNLAAARGTGLVQKWSAEARDALAKLMTPAQVAEAQRFATEWQAAFDARQE
jgi:TPR repeat protein